MISGIRNAPPISTSSPRDTTASPLRASADRATSRAPGAHHQAPRMGGDERRDVGLGEHGVHRGQPAPGVAGVAGVGHGFLALVVSRGAGFGTGISTTPRPSVVTPLKLIAPRTRTRYLAPGVSSCTVLTTSRS